MRLLPVPAAIWPRSVNSAQEEAAAARKAVGQQFGRRSQPAVGGCEALSTSPEAVQEEDDASFESASE